VVDREIKNKRMMDREKKMIDRKIKIK